MIPLMLRRIKKNTSLFHRPLRNICSEEYFKQDWKRIEEISRRIEAINCKYRGFAQADIPEKFGCWEYSCRRPVHKNHIVISRRRSSPNNFIKENENSYAENVVLDFNSLEKLYRQPIAFSGLKPSVDGDLIAIFVDIINKGVSSKLFIKHMPTNTLVELRLPIDMPMGSFVDVEWGSHAKELERTTKSDEKYLYVLMKDSDYDVRPSKIFLVSFNVLNLSSRRKKTGDRAAGRQRSKILSNHVNVYEVPMQDTFLLLEEANNQTFLSFSRSKDHQCLLAYHQTKTSCYASILEYKHDILALSHSNKGSFGNHGFRFPTLQLSGNSNSNSIVSSSLSGEGPRTFVNYSSGYFYFISNWMPADTESESGTPSAPNVSNDELNIWRLKEDHLCCEKLVCSVPEIRNEDKFRSNREASFSNAECPFQSSLKYLEPIYLASVGFTHGRSCTSLGWDMLEPVSISDYDILQSHIVIYGRYNNPNYRLFGLPTVQVMHLLPPENGPNRAVDYHSLLSECLTQYFSNTRPEYQSFGSCFSKFDNVKGYEIFEIIPLLNSTHNAECIQMNISSPLCQSLPVLLDLNSHSVEIGLSQASKESVQCIDVNDKSWYGHYSLTRLVTKGDVPVPITLVHSKELKYGQNPDHSPRHSDRRPVLLIGYGSYGLPLSLEFRAELIYLLEQNWIVAYAHVRGGGEGGRAWHRGGQLQAKMSTFDDYYSCGKLLIDLGVTDYGMLCGEGSSAGGLIMGVMANNSLSGKAQNLFTSLLLRNPFLSVHDSIVNRASDKKKTESTKAGDGRDKEFQYIEQLIQYEEDEWGSFACEDALKYINSYCPLYNIQRIYESGAVVGTGSNINRMYPSIYLTANAFDNKISATHAESWLTLYESAITTAQVTGPRAEPNTVCVFNKVYSGDHQGSATVSDQIKESAKEILFLLGTVKQPK